MEAGLSRSPDRLAFSPEHGPQLGDLEPGILQPATLHELGFDQDPIIQIGDAGNKALEGRKQFLFQEGDLWAAEGRRGDRGCGHDG